MIKESLKKHKNKILLSIAALTFALSMLLRSESAPQAELPPTYAQFSHISTLITEKKYDEALHAAEVLQPTLPKASRLSAFNLVRLAFLAHTLGDMPKCVTYLKQAQTDPHYTEVAALFQERTYSLKDFLLIK